MKLDQTLNRCILIVDDEERIREVVRACLEDLGGWKTLTAKSGQDGLISVEARKIDAILLDVSMPDMDGLQFFEQLRKQFDTRPIPVILLTAKMLPSDRTRFSEMGVAGIITKPFNPVLLHDQIAAILGWD
ncbi:MAG TPA: response regulator [Elainellaceae cyanobacterium]